MVDIHLCGLIGLFPFKEIFLNCIVNAVLSENSLFNIGKIKKGKSLASKQEKSSRVAFKRVE